MMAAKRYAKTVEVHESGLFDLVVWGPDLERDSAIVSTRGRVRTAEQWLKILDSIDRRNAKAGR